MTALSSLPEGTAVAIGDRVVALPAIPPGHRVMPVARAGQLVIIGPEAYAEARRAVMSAAEAARQLARAPAEAVTRFFDGFAGRLEDDAAWAAITRANEADVASALARGRSTTRLRVSDAMRVAMIEGLRAWARTAPRVGEIVERRQGSDFVLERRRAPLGVVAFVFEGRPNVLADGAGVIRNGNAAVMRIGGDALGTAEALLAEAIAPALRGAGLPEGAVSLVRSRDHGAGQALFTFSEVRLAVARGSGPTVALLGAIAEQHGIPSSLHGTGGAWLVVEETAAPEAVESAIRNSLDRKVCNTLNVVLVTEAALAPHGARVAQVLASLGAKVHAVAGREGPFRGEPLAEGELGREWEWEQTPEVTVAVVRDLDEAAVLFNRYSPRFIACILSGRSDAVEDLYARVDAPFVGNGFTRWVDGQWAWLRPELGLTNWESGRLLGRSGFLSGDDITTVRDVFLDASGRAPQRR